MQNYDSCPVHNGEKHGCPYYDSVFGKCFSHCDLSSPLRCGNCAHWYGICTTNGKRHDKIGNCAHYIGTIGAGFQTNCEHYTERKSNEPNPVDWIETRVIELGGKPDSSPESRKLRIQANKEWIDAHN